MTPAQDPKQDKNKNKLKKCKNINHEKLIDFEVAFWKDSLQTHIENVGRNRRWNGSLFYRILDTADIEVTHKSQKKQLDQGRVVRNHIWAEKTNTWKLMPRGLEKSLM